MNAHQQQQAANYLIRQDERLAAVIAQTPLEPLGRPVALFAALCQAVISQQLSKAAADAIFTRFCDCFHRRHPTPIALADLADRRLLEAGISRSKAAYLRQIALVACEGGLERRQLQRLSDVELITRLTTIKGIGRWSAEMVMMFNLKRPDLLPLDDVGIQRAMQALYGLQLIGRPLQQRMLALAELWRPHRTLACRYLWRWRRS